MALLYKDDRTIKEVTPNNGTDFTLEELQEMVGGNIEIVQLPPTLNIMVINEEGKLLKLPINENATAYAHALRAIRGNDYIAGNALVCRKEQVK